jgi:hypothetical protein
MASAFSGILAYGFTNMNGLGSLGKGYGQHYTDPEAEDPYAYVGEMSGIAGWRCRIVLSWIS